jgi:regulator of protease activity HflC (stomatin/prohibitin superfamily)
MTKERQVAALNGWLAVVVNMALLALTIAVWIRFGVSAEQADAPPLGLLLLCVLCTLALVFWTRGYFSLQPNEAQVLVLLGSYLGTVRHSGFHWANPFALPTPRAKLKVSLRIRNFESERLKVNDKRGNPIEIGAVVVWRVADTAQALFDVDSYERYVKTQSEAAIRHLANSYPYDPGEGEEMTLRGDVETVSTALLDELHKRLQKAGVIVEETRLTHLAYAPEIAGVMLRRQQAEAVIAARQKIVHGAVSMVEMALHELSEKKVLELDEERKASMVSNLLVVLCSESAAEPVVNTGTLYQ